MKIINSDRNCNVKFIPRKCSLNSKKVYLYYIITPLYSDLTLF